jgi:hypothetical protein
MKASTKAKARPRGLQDSALIALAPAIAAAYRRFDAAFDKAARAEAVFDAKKKPKPVEPEIADPLFVEMKSAAEKWAGERETRRNHPLSIAYRRAVRRWEQHQALLKRQCGLAAAERARDKALDKTIDLQVEVASIRATTLRGLILKASYAAKHHRGQYDEAVMVSIVDDLLAMEKRGEAANV